MSAYGSGNARVLPPWVLGGDILGRSYLSRFRSPHTPTGMRVSPAPRQSPTLSAQARKHAHGALYPTRRNPLLWCLKGK